MKFKATITMPGEPGAYHCLGVNAPEISECEALNEWLCGHSAGTTRSDTTLHLFDCVSDDDALCGSYVPGQDSCRKLSLDGFNVNTNRALHYAVGGRKYKICLKCRKIAEGVEQ